MDRIPTKIILKTHASFILYFIQVLKIVRLINIHKIKSEPPDLFFILAYTSDIIFHKLLELQSIYLLQRYSPRIFFFNNNGIDSLKSNPPNGQNLLSVT